MSGQTAGRGLGSVVSFAAALLIVGCGPKTISPAADSASRSGSATVDWADLDLVLHRVVVGEKIDAAKLLANRALVGRVLAMAARVGPDSTPDQFADHQDHLAYFINCHNASMLRSLIGLASDDGIPARLPTGPDRRFRFLLDGRLRTPADMAEEAIRFAGADWRVRFALYSGRGDGPALCGRVFLPGMLDEQLDHVTREALQSERVVRIDHGVEKRLLLWRGLYEIRDRLVRDYEARFKTGDATILNVILEWSDRFRRETLNSAVGYAEAVMPADHRLGAINAAGMAEEGGMPGEISP